MPKARLMVLSRNSSFSVACTTEREFITTSEGGGVTGSFDPPRGGSGTVADPRDANFDFRPPRGAPPNRAYLPIPSRTTTPLTRS